MSVEISPIVTVGLLSVCALLTVFAVTRLIELNPLINAWAQYHRHVVSRKTFG